MLNQEQLDLRASLSTPEKPMIGGSEAPALLEKSPYMTQLELFCLKRNIIEGKAGMPIQEERRLRLGNLKEDLLIQMFMDETGKKVRRSNVTQFSAEYPWAFCHLDGVLVGEKANIECKTMNRKEGWGEEGSDQVPDSIIVQCQHQMAVKKAELTYIPVEFPFHEFKIYAVKEDKELIAMLMDLEKGFIERVIANSPPEPNYEHKTTNALLRKLYAGTNGQRLILPEEVEHWHKVYQESGKLASEYSRMKDMAENHIRSIMKDCAIGVLYDGSGYERKVVKRKGYVVEDVEYIDFRYKKKFEKDVED